MASFIRVLLLEVQRQRRRRRGGRMYTEVARWDARMRMKMGKEARWEDGGRNERVDRQQMMLVGSTTDGDASARLRTGCWSTAGGILRVLPWCARSEADSTRLLYPASLRPPARHL